jgi:PKD repeat protein
MSRKFLIFLIAAILFLTVNLLFATEETDDPNTRAPEGEINSDYEDVEDADSWITVQYRGKAPGMDQYRFGNQDFGWFHTFDPTCKDIYDVRLTIRAWDVDFGAGERDGVYADGVFLGFLRGGNNRWSNTNFNIPVILLNDGKVRIRVDIDQNNGGWAVTVDWSRMRTHWDWVPPVADFMADQTVGVDHLCVKFKNLSRCADRFMWDFGDGTTSTKRHPEHCFHNPPHKHYDITLYAWGPGGKDMMVKKSYITVRRSTAVAFNAETMVGIPGMEVQFENNCGGTANHFLWDFGDGTEAYLQHSMVDKTHPTHVYEEPGAYNVSLKAWGAGGEDEMIVEGLIYIDQNYAPLDFVDGTPTDDKYPWENAIDQDIISTNAQVAAIAQSPASAVFRIDDQSPRAISKVRIALNKACGQCCRNTLAKDFELYTSLDGIDFELALTGCLGCTKGGWQIFEFEPRVAHYVRLVLLNAYGECSKVMVISEFQAFGEPVPDMGLAVAAEKTGGIETLPEAFGLAQNYPNPFNPTTTISYELPEAADVLVNVYNIQGQHVSTLLDAKMDAGYYEMSWNGTDLYGKEIAGGLYFYKITARTDAETFTATRKMTFMK